METIIERLAQRLQVGDSDEFPTFFNNQDTGYKSIKWTAEEYVNMD